jgi:hypothetical protein
VPRTSLKPRPQKPPSCPKNPKHGNVEPLLAPRSLALPAMSARRECGLPEKEERRNTQSGTFASRIISSRLVARPASRTSGWRCEGSLTSATSGLTKPACSTMFSRSKIVSLSPIAGQLTSGGTFLNSRAGEAFRFWLSLYTAATASRPRQKRVFLAGTNLATDSRDTPGL